MQATGREVAALSIALREFGRRMDEGALRLLPEEAKEGPSERSGKAEKLHRWRDEQQETIL